jgi:tetratricopeptide (TPR) repeat protein
VDALDELRSALHRDPRGVAAATSRLAAAAQADGDASTLSRALAVLGRARRSLGEIDLAEGDFVGALSAAATAGDDELAADAHIGLAGVLSFAGRSAEAFDHLDTAHRLGSQRLRAYTALQRAVIEQRIGHMTEALAGYESALPTLRRLGAWVDLALVLMNRGVIRTQSGECEAAIADLTEARTLFEGERHSFGVAQTCHSLGWTHARRGDLPLALRHLDEATEAFRRLGHAALEVDIDRIEVLLSAGLNAWASELAVETAQRLGAAGNHSKAAETWLLCAQAAMLDGDRAGSVAYAERARALFADQGSPGWELAARLEVLRCSGSTTDVNELHRLAIDLDAAGNARGAATALALASMSAAEAAALDRAAALSAECARRAGRIGVFEVRMLAALALATCAIARGDHARALRRVRTGLDDLRRQRSSLAATDARASVSVHAAQLASLGLRLALQNGSAATVLAWMERTRADRDRHRAPRPPDDGSFAADLTELRSVVALLRRREVESGATTDLLRRAGELERAIQRRQLRAEVATAREPTATPGAGELARRLGGRILVSLAEIDGRLIGVVVGGAGRGRARIADVGAAGEVYDVAATVTTALRTAIIRQVGGGSARRSDLLGRAAGALDHALSGLLAGDGPAVLVMPAAMHSVPWPLLPSLAGRPVVLVPSATWWWEVEADTPAATGGVVTLVAGPRLTEAEPEVSAIADCYPGAATLTGANATTGAALAAMDRSTMAHIACHGRIRHDNPLWSSLELFDGPLYVYDLEQLRRTPPLVVLSGCETGVGVRAGDRLLGLSTALLDRGTHTLVASICALPDSPATRDVMTAFHRRVSGGATPATALAALSAEAGRDGGAVLAAGLACFGVH